MSNTIFLVWLRTISIFQNEYGKKSPRNPQQRWGLAQAISPRTLDYHRLRRSWIWQRIYAELWSSATARIRLECVFEPKKNTIICDVIWYADRRLFIMEWTNFICRNSKSPLIRNTWSWLRLLAKRQAKQLLGRKGCYFTPLRWAPSSWFPNTRFVNYTISLDELNWLLMMFLFCFLDFQRERSGERFWLPGFQFVRD